MDPFLIAFFVVVAVRYLVGDLIAWWRGEPSPRVRDREGRRMIEAARIEAGQGPSIRAATAQRIADRIATPRKGREPGVARQFFGRWWADVWFAADERRESAQAKRARAAADEAARERARLAAERERLAAERREAQRRADEEAGIVDAETGDPPSGGRPRAYAKPGFQQRPEPHPAPEPPKKGSPTVTAPTIISGDIGSPQEALAFCEAGLAVTGASCQAVDQVVCNLRAEGVGEDFLGILGTVYAALSDTYPVIEEARDAFTDHVRVQADLLADPDLRNAVLGYLSAARAN